MGDFAAGLRRVSRACNPTSQSSRANKSVKAARQARENPFIARLTRAHLNFEVKDAPKARRLRRSMILEFKVQMRFSAAVR
jgi:hypothetical protein